MNKPKLKILITGASGFSGHHMARLFAKEFDVVTHAHHQKITNRMAVYDFYGDLSNKFTTQLILEDVQPDVIIHCAGRVPAKSQNISKDDFIRCNHVTTASIVSVASEMMEKPHIILPSTAAVYPVEDFSKFEMSLEWFFDNKLCIQSLAETDIKSLSDMSDYGLSKRLSEEALESYRGPWTVFRKPTVVGTHDERGNFVYQSIFHVLNGSEFGFNDEDIPADNLGHIREYITVQDIYYAMYLAITNKQSYGQIFNISASEPMSGYEVLKNVAEFMSVGLQRNVFDVVTPSPEHINMKTVVIMDTSQARRILNYQPVTDAKQVFSAVSKLYCNPEQINDHKATLKSILAL